MLLYSFLSHVSTLTRDINLTFCPSVRPSVCLSIRDVPVLDENGLIIYCHNFFAPYGSPIFLVLPESNIFTKFRRGHPPAGALNTGGYKISRIRINNSLYLANDTIYRHSYYGRLIGTHVIYQMVAFPMTLNKP